MVGENWIAKGGGQRWCNWELRVTKWVKYDDVNFLKVLQESMEVI